MAQEPNRVAAQYERWVYPPPIQDLDEYKGRYDVCDPLIRHVAYWPERPAPREDLDVLIAGCGTNAAARYAYHHPRYRVVGVDMSGSSLAHEEYLRARHHLENLTLVQGRIEALGELLAGRSFDFIECSGVLHHLPEPADGLRALRQLLRIDGVLFLMLYGKYGRLGVYMMQELFRLLGLGQTERDVQRVREILAVLKQDHPALQYMGRTDELRFDAALVDTFLHPIDRAYTVADCLALLGQCDLVHQGWLENHFYYPDASLEPGLPGTAAIQALPEPMLWQATELVGSIAQHSFYCCRPDRPAKSYRVTFEGSAFLDYLPRFAGGTQVSSSGSDASLRVELARPPLSSAGVAGPPAGILLAIDGRASVRECLLRSSGTGSAVVSESAGRGLFRTLWRAGHLEFQLPTA